MTANTFAGNGGDNYGGTVIVKGSEATKVTVAMRGVSIASSTQAIEGGAIYLMYCEAELANVRTREG